MVQRVDSGNGLPGWGPSPPVSGETWVMPLDLSLSLAHLVRETETIMTPTLQGYCEDPKSEDMKCTWGGAWNTENTQEVLLLLFRDGQCSEESLSMKATCTQSPGCWNAC